MHDNGLEAEVFGFELTGERGLYYRGDAPKILDVGLAGYLPRGLEVLEAIAEAQRDGFVDPRLEPPAVISVVPPPLRQSEDGVALVSGG